MGAVQHIALTHLDGSLELQEYRLRDEDFTSFGAEKTDFSFEKLNLLARPAASNFEQPIDYRIKIDLMLVCHLELPPWEEGSRRNRVVERIDVDGILIGAEELAEAQDGADAVSERLIIQDAMYALYDAPLVDYKKRTCGNERQKVSTLLKGDQTAKVNRSAIFQNKNGGKIEGRGV